MARAWDVGGSRIGARVAGAVVIAGVFALLGFGGCKADCPKDDANACTLDLCEGGEPVYEPMPNGATCHVGAQAGVCVERTCVLPCSGAKGNECDDGNPCTADACVEATKTCVHVNAGVTPPEDGNECTYGVCIAGETLHLPKNDWTPCGAQGVCKQGICSACSAASDCGKDAECMTWTCKNGACVPELDAEGKYVEGADIIGDCRIPQCGPFGAIVEILALNDEPPDEGSACTKEVCAGFTPYHQPLDDGSFCPGGVCSDGGCVECTTDLHCGTKYCFDKKCYECDNGVQDGNEADVDCGGSCLACAGEPCGKDSECKTGHCADGVCCNTACGTCLTCVSPGFIGQCKVVPKYGEEPPACSIASGKMCNGVTICKIALGFPCLQGSDCASGICKSGLCAAMP